MKQYKVIALSVGATSNRIFKAKDIVSEDAFPESQAEELVKQGFLEPYDKEEVGDADPDDTDNAYEISNDSGDEISDPIKSLLNDAVGSNNPESQAEELVKQELQNDEEGTGSEEIKDTAKKAKSTAPKK